MIEGPENYLTWFDFQTWSEHKPDYYSEGYCYHRAKGNCVGDVDHMEVKVLYRRGKPHKHLRGLCAHHFALLKAKGVPFVG